MIVTIVLIAEIMAVKPKRGAILSVIGTHGCGWGISVSRS
jgi:hypothetical protein